MIRFVNVLLLYVTMLGLPYVTQGQISAIFSKKDLKKLKETKTVFFHRKYDDPELLEKVLKEVWTITDIEVVSYRKMPAYLREKGYSYLSMNGHWNGKSPISHQLFVDLKLWMYENNEEVILSEISIHPDGHVLKYLKENHRDPEECILYLYQHAELSNWKPGFLKVYLGFLNNQLKEEKKRDRYKSVVDIEQLAALKNKTLYVPEYCLRGYDNRIQDRKKIFEKYNYKYLILPDALLSYKITSAEEPFYYLLFVYTGKKRSVSIYNSKTQEMIYHTGGTFTFSLTPNNIKSISQKIEQSTKRNR